MAFFLGSRAVKGRLWNVPTLEERAKAYVNNCRSAAVLSVPDFMHEVSRVQYLPVFPRFSRLFLICRAALVGSENRCKRQNSGNAKGKKGRAPAKFEREDHKHTPPRTIVEPNGSNSDAFPSGTAVAENGRGMPRIIS
jgi:hypothetical protein